ncbi:MAG: CRISPR-associated protein Csx20, partial [Campylobacterales bacterium]
MTSMFLLFSHSLTDEQIEDAKNSLGVDEFISLPDSLQQAWSSVPPELDGVREYAEAFYEFLSRRAMKGDFVLISGDFGLCYLLVQWC